MDTVILIQSPFLRRDPNEEAERCHHGAGYHRNSPTLTFSNTPNGGSGGLTVLVHPNPSG